MMRDMMTMTGGIQAQKVEDKERRAQEEMAEKERQLRERDERILRQEGRMDTAYDRALVTRLTIICHHRHLNR